jgi:hypothetical protein
MKTLKPFSGDLKPIIFFYFRGKIFTWEIYVLKEVIYTHPSTHNLYLSMLSG